MKQFSWAEYYDKFYEWSFSTQKSYSFRLTDYGSADEVFEVLEEFVFHDEAFASRFADKALNAGVRFSPEQIVEMILYMDEATLSRMAENTSRNFNREQLEELQLSVDDEVFARLTEKSGVDFFEEDYIDETNERSGDWNQRIQNGKGASLVDTYLKDKVVDIRVLNFEDGFKNTFVHFTKIYGNGEKENCRVNVKRLPGYYNFFTPKPIVSAEFIGKVHTGVIRTEVYMLFVVRLEDGTVQLIQTSESSQACLELLQMSDEMTYEPQPPERIEKTTVQLDKARRLKENELPQGEYLIGRDIPVGIYDFFVIYGHGGKFDYAKYNDAGEIVNGTWEHFYWVGTKEDYEHRELFHIKCEEGYTIKITGNVILRIAKSQRVKINI